MNSPSNDSPELTAYALGELSGAQASEVHHLLAHQPAALSELEQIEAITEALRQGAPIPQQRLTPDQRHALLHPTHLPRRVVPMMPRPLQATRRKPVLWSTFTVLTKAAAMIAVTALAFSLGRRTSLETKAVAAGETAAKATHSETLAQKSAPISTPLATKSAIEPLTGTVAKDKTALASAPAPAAKPEVEIQAPIATSPVATVAKSTTPAAPPALPEKAPLVVVPVNPSELVAHLQAPTSAKPGTPVVATTQPAKVAPAAIPHSFTTAPRSDVFVNASRKPGDQSELRPAKIRPLPVKTNPADLFAAPISAKAAADAKENGKSRPADLFIHSWKAEVLTCPWNEANRLLRVVIQLPADQPAATVATNAYPLQVTFDPNYVREYRQLCERHQPAVELRSAGTHVIWYEYQPNGAVEPAREMGKMIATVTLPTARFSTQTVDPFDGTKLRVMDRNQSWQNAREDVVFESSVVGFGMLLRGAPESSHLNHQLVLDLATKAKGADPTGERARFIRLVQDAKTAAGL